MKCSVFITLQSADQDRIVAKIAFDNQRNPVPDGPTVVTACQSHPTESVEAAVFCYATWKSATKFCTVGTAIS